MVAAVGASILSRVMQLSLPIHVRPLHDPALHFRVPSGIDPEALNHWSSFPGDHAAILFGLACAISGVSPVAGRAAYAVAIVLNFGRIYSGYHSPSDILSGALLGILAVKLSRSLACSDLSKNFYAVLMTKKPLFYACAFYLSVCIGTMFDDYRAAAAHLVHALRH